jgi:XTP/dITP diphosphohydrolase
MQLVFASNNAHKLTEIKAILGNEFKILSLQDVGYLEDIPETADTFEGNALIKARTLHAHTGLPTLADDSGLCTEALNGQPGVYSARYAGAQASSIDNCQKLLKTLGGMTNRRAYFKCVMAFIESEKEMLFSGEVHGEIDTHIKGRTGFGYDPIFIPEGYTQTFAEMTAELKNSMSHRKRALHEWATYMNFRKNP